MPPAAPIPQPLPPVPGSFDAVDTLADLKLRTARTDGERVSTGGCVTRGDGGGGEWFWDSASTATPNDGLIVQRTGVATGRYIRLHDGCLSPRWFGAVGDGIVDDAIPLQKCITAAYDFGRIVELGAGHYKTTVSLDMSINRGAFLHIRGTGDQSQINGFCTGQAVINCVGSFDNVFQDVWISGDTAARPSCAILLARHDTASAGTSTFRRVTTAGFFSKAALVSISSEVNQYYDCKFDNLADDADAVYINDQNDVLGITSVYASLASPQVGGNTVHQFNNCIIEGFGAGSRGCLFIRNVRHASFLGCFFTSGTNAYGIRIESTSPLACDDISIIGGSGEVSLSTHGLVIGANSTVASCVFGGRLDGGFYGEAGSLVQGCDIAGNFAGSGGVNVDSIIGSQIHMFGLGFTARTACTGNVFVGGLTTEADYNFPANSGGNTWSTQRVLFGGPYNIIHIADESSKDRIQTKQIKANIFQTRLQNLTAAGVGSPYSPVARVGATLSFLLNADITFDQPSDLLTDGSSNVFDEGSEITFIFRQDGTGGRVVSFNPTTTRPRGASIPSPALMTRWAFVMDVTGKFVQKAALGVAVRPYPTVTALKLTATAVRAAGDIVTTQGYTAIGDGGAGTWQWDAANVEADNGATVVQVTSVPTGRWLRTFGQYGKGVDTASANNLTLVKTGRVFSITGTTTINAITTSGWQPGASIVLIFAGATTVKHNTAGGGGTARIFLASGTDLATAANTVLPLVYDGTQWQEVATGVASLPAVGPGAGTIGSSSSLVRSVTLDAKGRVTAATATDVGALTTGLVKVTTTTGALTTGVGDTDYQVPLTFGNGVTRTTNAIASDLTTGKAGGQTATGGTGSGDNLTLRSTSNATKGKTIIGAGPGLQVDEVNNAVLIGPGGHTVATPATGDVVIDKGTSTSPALKLYSGNNANMGVDVTGAGADLRFVHNYGETGATENFRFIGTTTTAALKALGIQVLFADAGGVSLGDGAAGSGAQNVAVLLYTNGTIRFAISAAGDVGVGPGGTAVAGLKFLVAGRMASNKGANVASASTLTLGTDGNTFAITGTTTINYITTTSWVAGADVTLEFSTSVTLTHNAGSVPGGTAAMKFVSAPTSPPSRATASASTTTARIGVRKVGNGKKRKYNTVRYFETGIDLRATGSTLVVPAIAGRKFIPIQVRLHLTALIGVPVAGSVRVGNDGSHVNVAPAFTTTVAAVDAVDTLPLVTALTAIDLNTTGISAEVVTAITVATIATATIHVIGILI
jgi:hypothetical protein